MDTTWIVAANAGRARMFRREARLAPLEEVEDRVDDSARLRTADTESDQLGRHAASGSRHGAGAKGQPNGYEPHQTPAEHRAERFARELAGTLLERHRQGRFRRLVLVAGPEFLGVLRKQLDPQLAAIVDREIAKDYTASDTSRLREQIAAHEDKG